MVHRRGHRQEAQEYPDIAYANMAVTSAKTKVKSSSMSSAKKKTSASNVGAPAQHNQASRKGKKAWRKNVDLDDVEDKLEGLREEERVLGCVPP